MIQVRDTKIKTNFKPYFGDDEENQENFTALAQSQIIKNNLNMVDASLKNNKLF